MVFKISRQIKENFTVSLYQDRLAEFFGLGLELRRDQILQIGQCPLNIVPQCGLVFGRGGDRGCSHSGFRQKQIAGGGGGGRVGNRLDEL